MKLDLTPVPVLETRIEREKQYKQLGSMKRKPGLTLFEIDRETGRIIPAPLAESDTTSIDGKAGRAKLHKKNNCAYVWALNMKNAARKWQQIKEISGTKS